jgi:hypothetical protein
LIPTVHATYTVSVIAATVATVTNAVAGIARSRTVTFSQND